MASPWFKAQHRICFQVILPLLFDFSLRRHIYLATSTVYAIYLEKKQDYGVLFICYYQFAPLKQYIH